MKNGTCMVKKKPDAMFYDFGRNVKFKGNGICMIRKHLKKIGGCLKEPQPN